MATSIQRGYLDAPSGQIHYRMVGTGPALVLLHQTATTGRVYEPVMTRLADRYCCLAFDTPGFGGSDAPPRSYTMAEYAAAVVTAARGLGLDRFHLLGHHTGASIAAQAAAEYPGAVDRLILHSCPEGTDEFRRHKIEESTPLVIDRSGSHVDWVINRIRGYTTPLAPDEMHQFVLEYLIAAPRYHEAHLAVWTQRVAEFARSIQAPTLLLSGERDDFVVQHEELARTMQNARTMVLADRGRLCMIEDPDQYAQILADFLAG